MRGFFIAVEGLDGCGKTTQIEALAHNLTLAGYQVVVTKAPGGTPLGDELRALFLQHHRSCAPQVELGLLMTSMADTYHRIIQPALAAGKVVISDRFYRTTFAYQSAGKGIAYELVEAMRQLFLPQIEPDLWLYSRLQPELAEVRMAARRGTRSTMDAAGLAFFRRVAQGFDVEFSLRRIEAKGINHVVIEMDDTIEALAAYYFHIVSNRLTQWELTHSMAKTPTPTLVG